MLAAEEGRKKEGRIEERWGEGGTHQRVFRDRDATVERNNRAAVLPLVFLGIVFIARGRIICGGVGHPTAGDGRQTRA